MSIVDYGMGNLFSVDGAVRHCGAIPALATKPDEIQNAQRLIIPGVGAFGDGMKKIQESGLLEPIREFAKSGKPVLGICLGMQLLFEKSFEFGEHEGLALIPGNIVPIPSYNQKGEAIRVPHVGWNTLKPTEKEPEIAWRGSILMNTPPESSVYFVHSFFADCNDTPYDIADCDYNGVRIPAVVRNENIVGCQFHPEKSGPVGLQILSSFLEPA